MRTLAIVLLLGTAGAQAQEKPRLSKEEAGNLFNRRLRQLLEIKCLSCHGEDPKGKHKGGLDLRTRESAMKGGDSEEPVIVPGNAAKSRLYVAVTWKDEDLQMPPKKRDVLTPDQIDAIRRWIDAGAPWPDKKEGIDWSARKPEDVWAFMPVKKVSVPGGARHPIDAFVARKLKEKGLAAAGPADRITLIRRATWDLTGLPPAPEEIDAFLADRSEKAFEKVIDRLLDSPHYGEQWARHWLDVVRYADTAGFSNDWERPNSWRYRDYVIRSFNGDKPFNRFIREQIAGDELDAKNPEMRIAVGFLRMGPWEHTAMSVQSVTRQHFLDDITHNTAASFLGLTFRCARCHDHKFDPIPTKDYYRMQAVFASTQFSELPASFLPSENTEGFEKARAEGRARLKEKGYTPVGKVPDDPTYKRSLAKVGTKRKAHLTRHLERYEPLAFSVYNGPSRLYHSNRRLRGMPKNMKGAVPEVAVLKGGMLESPGEKVKPGVMTGIYRPEGKAGKPVVVPASIGGRRSALAEWIARPDNPFTSRVLVNRVWQHHFGEKGLVATPNNFGKMGKRPTHPELLDWLAGWFTGNGWSIKKLHRLILTSETYRRGGTSPDFEKMQEVDPANDFLSIYPARRLAAEEIRDGMLAVTGELSRKAGGPGIFPEINWEVALQPRHVMGGPAPAYQPSPRPEDRNRRTIYAFRRRTLSDPMLEVFNRPGSETSCECRDETTVTPQAFALFNGHFAHDRALALADRLMKRGRSDAGRIDLAFRSVYGRTAAAKERALCLAHLKEMKAYHAKHEPVEVPVPLKVRREMVEEFNGMVMRWDEDLDLMRKYKRDLKPWDVGPETRALAEVCLVLFNSNEFLYVR